MTIEEMRQYEWVIPYSGGKDSTAIVLKMIEYKVPIKEVVHVRMMYDRDTPAILPDMVNFIDNALLYFESLGIKTRIVESEKTALDLAQTEIKRSKYAEKNGKFYGAYAFMRGRCKFQGIKQKSSENAIADSYREMLGYTVDETHRLHRLNDKKQSILCTLNISQNEALEICKKANLLAPIYYSEIKRAGCFFCPNSGTIQRKLIKEQYPDLYIKCKKLVDMCDFDISFMKNENNWVKEFLK